MSDFIFWFVVYWLSIPVMYWFSIMFLYAPKDKYIFIAHFAWPITYIVLFILVFAEMKKKRDE